MKLRSNDGERQKRKDAWDKATVVSGLLTVVATAAIAIVGWHFTNSFKEAEQRAADLTIAEKMLPHLVKEGRESEAALALMAALSRAEVAAEMAILYGGRSSIDAMQRLQETAPTVEGRTAAHRALVLLTRQGTFAEREAAAKAANQGYTDPGYDGWGNTTVTAYPNYDPGTTFPSRKSEKPAKRAGGSNSPPPEILLYSSGPVLSGLGKQFSQLYIVCGEIPKGYRVVSHDFQLIGDRSCGAWATCEKSVSETNKICYRFALQGHDEGGQPGFGESEGVLRVVAQKGG